MNEPFYDPQVSYEVNYNKGPFGLFSQLPLTSLPKPLLTDFMGFSVNVPFGIPAGPLLNGKFVQAAWDWGYSIATYKTVRGNSYPCHPSPNVIKVRMSGRSIYPGEKVIGELDTSSIDVNKDGITNSFGVPSKPVTEWQKDVKETLKKQGRGNVMILSFMGTKKENMTHAEYVDDFVDACHAAKETGAPILEVNFSCPNVGKEGLICNDLNTSWALLEALKKAKGNTPLLVKIGYFDKQHQETLEKLIELIQKNAEGVCAINTIQATVTDEKGEQILPGNKVRLQSGICGATIKWAGLEMAQRIVEMRKRRNWKHLTVIGVGGVTTANDYFRYKKLGVNAVQSATGAMWNQKLAIQIRQQLVKN